MSLAQGRQFPSWPRVGQRRLRHSRRGTALSRTSRRKNVSRSVRCMVNKTGNNNKEMISDDDNKNTLLGSRLPKSQLAWYVKTARDQTVSRWFLLKAAGPWRGMWQLSAPRLTLTLISLCRVLAVWRRRQPLAKRRNTQLFGLTMISSRSRSDPGSYQWVGHFFSVWFGSANFAREREGQRALVFVPTHFSRHPAL